MKTLYTATILLFSLVFTQIAQAQCSEIYFYRTNGFQSKRDIFLYQNGVQLLTIKAGERYKATSCAQEALEFVVRTSENDMVPSKVSFTPVSGKNYYLKVNCAVGVEIASIKIQETAKGNKDVNNGNKFIHPIKSISIEENSANTATAQPITNTSSASFEKIQIIDNFKYEVYNITKAGEMLTMEFKITNLANEDRNLETCANMIYFYDDLGNLYFPHEVCIANSCSKMPSWIKSPTPAEKYSCHSSIKSANLMPSGIPVNAKITVRKINKMATKLVRGVVWTKGSADHKINYANIELPKVVDAENINKRNFGNQSIELIAAQRQEQFTYIHFKHTNQGTEEYTSQIISGELYDDLGSKYSVNAMSFGTKDKRIEYNRYHKKWVPVISPNSTADIYVIVDNIIESATNIRRITLTFEGFTLSWDNIDIKGSGKLGPEYIQYADFEKKVRSNQNVLGTKVILKNIHFSTGSDVILQDSHAQLNQLADLLKLNSSLKVEVSGHTDNVGDDLSNMVLSQKRADAIKYYLIGKAVQPNRVFSIGKGENEPISTNKTDKGKQENRRVEITVVK